MSGHGSVRVALLVWLALSGIAVARPRVIQVEPACAAPGETVVISGRNLRRAFVEVGGAAATVVARDRKQLSIIVPGSVPSGAAPITLLQGRKRSAATPFGVRGPEICDGADNDCDGVADNGIVDMVIGRRAGDGEPVYLRCRSGALLRDVQEEAPPTELCIADTIEPCYEGPPETRSVGECRDGAHVCGRDGTFGPCVGQTLPGDEDPGNGIDENCDGRDGPGGGELCLIGSLQACYSGPPRTRGIGVCRAGTRLCAAPGFYGNCEDQVLPSTEIPGNGIDENCDGADVVLTQQLDLVVNPTASPTFQPDVVISGLVGTQLAPPSQSSPFTADIAPRQGHQGETLDVTITGTNSTFASGTLSVALGTGVTVNSVTVQSAVIAVANVTVAKDASIGPRVVAITSGSAQTIAAHAFDVVAGLGSLTGRLLDSEGNPVGGAQVCISGTTHCTTTAADGTFTLDDTETTGTRVVITKPGFDEFSTPIAVSIGGTATLGDIAFAPPEEPPPPPPPNSPPVPPGVAILLGRGACEMRAGGNVAALEKMVRDTIIAVGGSESGVLDSQGNQMNPLVDGDGVVTLKQRGVEDIAMGLAGSESTSLGEVLAQFATSFTYHDEYKPPRLAAILTALQTRVNQSWADPSLPYAPLMFALFNQGRTALVDPPVVTVDHPLNRLQEYLLVTSLLTWLQETIEEGQTSGLQGRSRARARAADPPADPIKPSGNLWGDLFIEAGGQAFGPGVKSGLLKQCDTIQQGPGIKPPHCGDGILDPIEGEACDPPSKAGQAPLCDAKCQSLVFKNPLGCSNAAGMLEKLVSNVASARTTASANFTKYFLSESATRANAVRLKAQLESQAYQTFWSEAKKQATTVAIGNALVGIARGQMESALSNLQGKMVDMIFKLEIDLIIQSMRPEPPFITSAEQLLDPETGEPGNLVKITFKRSLNDHGADAPDNQTWYYSLYRQQGGNIARVNLGKVDGANGGPRSNPNDPDELVFYDSPGQGSVLYRVQAKRLIGQPPYERPPDDVEITMSFLSGFIPGASLNTKPLTGGGITVFNLDTLKVALDPIAKVLNGVKFQASELSDPDAVYVNLKPVPPAPPSSLAVDPNGSNIYLSIPVISRIFRADTGFGALSLFTDSNFKAPGQAGLAIDSAGNLYADNGASDELFGGRVFQFRGTDAARSLVGTVNYYSFMLGFAHPVGVIGMVAGPSPEGEALYIADGVANQIKRMRINVPFDRSRNVSQPVCNFTFGPRAAMAVRADGMLAVSFFGEIYLIDPANPVPTRLIQPFDNPFFEISGLSWDTKGNLYVSDAQYGTLTMIPAKQVVPELTFKGFTDAQKKRYIVGRGFQRPSDVSVTSDQLGVAFFDAQRVQSLGFGMSGQVTDENGDPMPNVQLTVAERSAVAVTDADGVFVMPKLVTPGATGVVDVTLRSGGRNQTERVLLESQGHSIRDFVFSPPPPPADAGEGATVTVQRPEPEPPITFNLAKGVADLIDITTRLPKVLPLPPSTPPADLATRVMLPVDGTTTPASTTVVKAIFNKTDITEAEVLLNGVSQGLSPVVNGLLEKTVPLADGANGVQIRAYDSSPKGFLGSIAGQVSKIVQPALASLDAPAGNSLGQVLTLAGGSLSSIQNIAGREIPQLVQSVLGDLQLNANSIVGTLEQGALPTAAQQTALTQSMTATDQAGRQSSGGLFGSLVSNVTSTVLGKGQLAQLALNDLSGAMASAQGQIPQLFAQIDPLLQSLQQQPPGSLPAATMQDANAIGGALSTIKDQLLSGNSPLNNISGIVQQMAAAQERILQQITGNVLSAQQKALLQPLSDAAAQAVPSAQTKVNAVTEAYTQSMVAVGGLSGGGTPGGFLGAVANRVGDIISPVLNQSLSNLDTQVTGLLTQVAGGQVVSAAQTTQTAAATTAVQNAAGGGGGGGFLSGVVKAIAPITSSVLPQLVDTRAIFQQVNGQVSGLLNDMLGKFATVDALPAAQKPEGYQGNFGGFAGVGQQVLSAVSQLKLPDAASQIQVQLQSGQIQQLFTTLSDIQRVQRDATVQEVQFSKGGEGANAASDAAPPADYAVVARMLDSDTGQPITGATLSVPGTPFVTTTDKFGVGTLKMASQTLQNLNSGATPVLDSVTTQVSGDLAQVGNPDLAAVRIAVEDMILKSDAAVGKIPAATGLQSAIDALLQKIRAAAGNMLINLDQGTSPSPVDVQEANANLQEMLNQLQVLQNTLKALIENDANIRLSITGNLQ